MPRKLPLVLPCFPCPHQQRCCHWGVYLTPEEAKTLVGLYGESVVTYDGAEFRTAVVENRCTFLAPDGACRIHKNPEYPRVCGLFPYESIDGDPVRVVPYPTPEDSCPEFL